MLLSTSTPSLASRERAFLASLQLFDDYTRLTAHVAELSEELLATAERDELRHSGPDAAAAASIAVDLAESDHQLRLLGAAVEQLTRTASKAGENVTSLSAAASMPTASPSRFDHTPLGTPTSATAAHHYAPRSAAGGSARRSPALQHILPHSADPHLRYTHSPLASAGSRSQPPPMQALAFAGGVATPHRGGPTFVPVVHPTPAVLPILPAQFDDSLSSQLSAVGRFRS